MFPGGFKADDLAGSMNPAIGTTRAGYRYRLLRDLCQRLFDSSLNGGNTIRLPLKTLIGTAIISQRRPVAYQR